MGIDLEFNTRGNWKPHISSLRLSTTPLLILLYRLLHPSDMAEAAALLVAKQAGISLVGKAAGAAISYFVSKVLGRLTAEDKDLRQRLEEKLPTIEAIYHACYLWQVQGNQALGRWLWKFRDAMQEAEDALDNLEFLDLEKKVKDWKAQEAKTWRAALLSQIGRGQEFRRTGGKTKSLKDALKKLDSVLSTAPMFVDVIRSGHHSPSTSNQGWGKHLGEVKVEFETTIFGLQKEKHAVVEWLGVQTPDLVEWELSVCAIVGCGGMGKTTLAQFICHDERVRNLFHNNIIWVHVCKNFEPNVVVNNILQLGLTEELASSRFLLVLDDAWEDMEDQKWKDFSDLLRRNALIRGRILLTTRMKSVADAVKRQIPVGYKCLEIMGLDEEHTVKLFNHHAFHDSIPTGRMDLRLVGEQIARKLKGCPFVATILGQQLSEITDRGEWEKFLHQDIHYFSKSGPKIMCMLEPSYRDLSYEVQRCFRYFSIFPPHYKFKMEEVIELWVCAGLILRREGGGSNQYEIARDCFNVLLQKSFFLLVPREDNDSSEDFYVMHDLMYELACFVSSEECSRYKVGGHNTGISPGVRHLYIQGVNSKAIDTISQSKHLRTLIIKNEGHSIKQEHLDALKRVIKERTSLRALKLDGDGWLGMNDAVSELKHLRYIYMSTTDEPNLHKVFKLCHLQVLKIIQMEKGRKAGPFDIGNLYSLHKLHLPESTLSRIPHIGRLSTLEELNGFSVRKNDGHRITELQDLRNIRKIIVLDVQNVSNCSEAKAANLDNKSDLKSLSLGWSYNEARFDAQILNKLAPHRNLLHLIVSGYSGIQSPMWMKPRYLSNLVCLEIHGCVEWDELLPLDNLHALKHLFLTHLPKLKYISSSSDGSDAYGYRENRAAVTPPGSLPPHLVTFVVKDCPLFKKLPVLPFSLQFLGVHAVGMNCLPKMSDETTLRDAPIVEPQLSVLHIQSCDLLVFLNGCFIQEEHYKALSVLKLIQCDALRSLPNASHFKRISELQIVEIVECKSLSSLGGLGALSCLKSLKIERCRNLLLHTPEESYCLELETLAIDDHRLLASSQLKNLCRTRRLVISDMSEAIPEEISSRSNRDLLPNQSQLPEEWLLQNSSHLEFIEISNTEGLQFLPSNMHHLLTLRSLLLHNAPHLHSLPLMPPYLWELIINGCCTELEEQCQVGGSEWEKIYQIPCCHIYPKGDDRQTLNLLRVEGSTS